jgi:hypothetical protein
MGQHQLPDFFQRLELPFFPPHYFIINEIIGSNLIATKVTIW